MRRPSRLGRWLRLGLSLTLTCNFLIPNGFSQTPPPSELNLVVVEGEGAANTTRQRVAVEPVVKVEDENHRPITGAAVVFTLPISGTSGEFSKGSKSLTVTTGPDGLAVAHGLKTNQIPGRLQIYVTASYRGLRARTLINQVTSGTSGTASHGSSKLWVVLVVVGAAAAGGAVVALQSKGNSTATSPAPSAPTPIGITPGTGSIAPPH